MCYASATSKAPPQAQPQALPMVQPLSVPAPTVFPGTAVPPAAPAFFSKACHPSRPKGCPLDAQLSGGHAGFAPSAVPSQPPVAAAMPVNMVPQSAGGQVVTGNTLTYDEYHRRLTIIYSVHNAEKVSTVDYLLRKYEGVEDTLYQKVCAKYHVDPINPDASLRSAPPPWATAAAAAAVPVSPTVPQAPLPPPPPPPPLGGLPGVPVCVSSSTSAAALAVAQLAAASGPPPAVCPTAIATTVPGVLGNTAAAPLPPPPGAQAVAAACGVAAPTPEAQAAAALSDPNATMDDACAAGAIQALLGDDDEEEDEYDPFSSIPVAKLKDNAEIMMEIDIFLIGDDTHFFDDENNGSYATGLSAERGGDVLNRVVPVSQAAAAAKVATAPGVAAEPEAARTAREKELETLRQIAEVITELAAPEADAVEAEIGPNGEVEMASAEEVARELQAAGMVVEGSDTEAETEEEEEEAKDDSTKDEGSAGSTAEAADAAVVTEAVTDAALAASLRKAAASEGAAGGTAAPAAVVKPATAGNATATVAGGAAASVEGVGSVALKDAYGGGVEAVEDSGSEDDSSGDDSDSEGSESSSSSSEDEDEEEEEPPADPNKLQGPPSPRNMIVRAIFKALDPNNTGLVASEQMERFATLNGFDGPQEEWSEEFESLCKEWDVDPTVGFTEVRFAKFVNDESDQGCYCDDKELKKILGKLRKLGEADAAPAAKAQARSAKVSQAVGAAVSSSAAPAAVAAPGFAVAPTAATAAAGVASKTRSRVEALQADAEALPSQPRKRARTEA